MKIELQIVLGDLEFEQLSDQPSIRCGRSGLRSRRDVAPTQMAISHHNSVSKQEVFEGQTAAFRQSSLGKACACSRSIVRVSACGKSPSVADIRLKSVRCDPSEVTLYVENLHDNNHLTKHSASRQTSLRGTSVANTDTFDVRQTDVGGATPVSFSRGF